MVSNNELEDRDPKLIEIIKSHNAEYEKTEDVGINDLVLAVYTYGYDKGYADGYGYGSKQEKSRTNSFASDKEKPISTDYVYSLRAQCEQLAKEVENQAQEIIDAREIQEELENKLQSCEEANKSLRKQISEDNRGLEDEHEDMFNRPTALAAKLGMLGYSGKLTKVETLIVGDYEDEVVAKTKA